MTMTFDSMVIELLVTWSSLNIQEEFCALQIHVNKNLFFFLQTRCYSNDMLHSQYERGLFSWCLVTVKLFIAVHPRSRWQLYKKIEDTDISLAIGTQIYSDFSFLDSSKSKANMIWKTVSLATFFVSWTFVYYVQF